ncbi:MAG: hypothetical protein JSS66_18835 [Armatimonadetes bacterium]|nr:hypothetical protein [Armatimonadota bacterium]
MASAMRGKRGQTFFRDLIAALDAMPEKKLVSHVFEYQDGSVCALGALAKVRGIDLNLREMDPEDDSNAAVLAERLDIATCLARETIFENDQGHYDIETPESRWRRIRAWAVSNLRDAP